MGKLRPLGYFLTGHEIRVRESIENISKHLVWDVFSSLSNRNLHEGPFSGSSGSVYPCINFQINV